MKKTVLAIALGIACYASNANAGLQPASLLEKAKTAIVLPRIDLKSMAKSAMAAIERFHCDYEELLSRIEAEKVDTDMIAAQAPPANNRHTDLLPRLDPPQEASTSDAKALSTSASSESAVTADPIRARGLLEEYLPYDFAVNDQLWINRLHHQYTRQATSVDELQFLEQYLAASNNACHEPASENTDLELNQIASEVSIVPLEREQSSYAFFIRQIPVDYSWASTTSIAQEDTSEEAWKSFPPESEPTAEVANVSPEVSSAFAFEEFSPEGLQKLFGVTVLPFVDLQPMGLAGLKISNHFIESRKFLCTAQAIAQEFDSRNSTSDMPAPSLSSNSIDVVADHPPVVSSASNDAWRTLMSYGLKSVKSKLTATYGLVDQLDQWIANDSLSHANIAGKQSSNR